jgi:hypothetical protein
LNCHKIKEQLGIIMKASIIALTIALTACSVCAKEYHVSTAGLDGNPGLKDFIMKTAMQGSGTVKFW